METTPGLYSMGQSQGGYVHAFLLDDGNGLTLIDTLFDVDAKRILAQLQAIGKTVQDIKHIILTHAHRSHLGGLAKLKELTGAPVYAHEWEADIVSRDRRAQPVSILPYPPYRAYPLQIGLNLDIAKHVPSMLIISSMRATELAPYKSCSRRGTRRATWRFTGLSGVLSSPAMRFAPGQALCLAGKDSR